MDYTRTGGEGGGGGDGLNCETRTPTQMGRGMIIWFTEDLSKGGWWYLMSEILEISFRDDFFRYFSVCSLCLCKQLSGRASELCGGRWLRLNDFGNVSFSILSANWKFLQFKISYVWKVNLETFLTMWLGTLGWVQQNGGRCKEVESDLKSEKCYVCFHSD